MRNQQTSKTPAVSGIYRINCEIRQELVKTKTDDPDTIPLPGYTVFTKNRCTLTKVRSGGVAVIDMLMKHVHVNPCIINIDHCKFVSWLQMKNVCLDNVDK